MLNRLQAAITYSTDPISNPDTIPPVVSDDFMSRDGYVIPKEKDLPKLHRAVWKGDLVKVQQITKNFKKNEVNAVDKEKRCRYILLLSSHFHFLLLSFSLFLFV